MTKKDPGDTQWLPEGKSFSLIWPPIFLYNLQHVTFVSKMNLKKA